jgi:DNA-binding beta-propeller fold protein YncE
MKKIDYRLTLKTIAVCMIAIALLFSLAPASNAQTGRAFVSSQDGTKVFVFDLSKNSLIKTIDIFTPSPLGAALPPNINDIIRVGDKIFLTVPGPEIGEAGINSIKVIDLHSAAILATLKTGITPSGLLAYKDKVYVVNRYGNTIQEINPRSLKIVRTIPFSAPKPGTVNNPLFMEIVNDKIYLPYPGGLSRPGLIQILDLQTGETVKSIDFSPVSNYGPLAIKKVGPDKIYLGGAQSIGVLDTRSDTITKTIALSTKEVYVQSFAVYGEKVYVANGVSTVNVIDSQSDTLIDEIDIGYHSYACHLKAGLSAAMNKVFVADAGRGLKVIDTAKGKMTLTITAHEPLGAIVAITE